MKLLLLISIMLMSMGHVLSQPHEEKTVYPEISQDSLIKVYQRIDELSLSQLTKVQEMFRYKSRNEPSQQNKDILLYIDEKINQIK